MCRQPWSLHPDIHVVATFRAVHPLLLKATADAFIDPVVVVWLTVTAPNSLGRIQPFSAREPLLSIGAALRQARQAAGLDLADVAALGNVSRGHLCNVEKGRRTASPAVLQAYEKALGMHRRTLLKLTGTGLGAAMLATGDDQAVARDLYASIAAGDDGPLAFVQTSHAMDHAVARLAAREAGTLARLGTWLEDGADPVLRVNAAGILAKTGSPELADGVALGLARDQSMRDRYLTAVRARVGDRPDRLARELSNPRDSGARWCAAHLLARSGHTSALITAMRTEPSRENLRAMALAISGTYTADHLPEETTT